MADLETLQKAADRSAKKARAGDKDAVFEKDVFARAVQALEAGKPLRTESWSPRELEALKPLFLITIKPVLFVANVSDKDLEGKHPFVGVVRAYAERTGARMIALCGNLEGEIAALDPADRAEFLREMGIAEPGLARLARATYDLLGLQTFFTAGQKEIRAWTIQRGWAAPQAAGVIHSDFEKLFIRAEIYSIDDLVKHGSEAAIKAAGKLRVEGRDYVMRESDVCHFLIGK
jgi:GTP-binding protein YchF